MSRQYGSLYNTIINSSVVPAIGMGATEICWTDRHPYEIIAIKDPRHISVRLMDYKRTDDLGPSESQEYEYTSNEGNPTKELFFTHRGVWRERNGRALGNKFVLGVMEEYYDFTF